METIVQLYGLTIVLVFVVGLLMTLYKLWVGDRYIQEAKKLQIKMMNLRRDFPELENKRGKIVGAGLGDLGIEGIMEELGIDPNIIRSPFVKGLFDKYAPKLLEQLNKKQTEATAKTDESWL